MIDYIKIAEENRNKLNNINLKVRIYKKRRAVDFYYKNKLVITALTEDINEVFICKYMIESYNSYTKHKRFGKKDIIEL